MQLVIGRITRAHGTQGEVSVEVRTDAVERFAPGSSLATDPADRGPLTVRSARWHHGRLLLEFAEVADRTAAESLRGTLLVADSATSPGADDDDTWWDHELVGLAAEAPDGERLGEVAEVTHGPGGDLLVVRRPGGAELLVPFVAAIVPTVDVAGGRVVVDPPEGLLEL